MGQCASDRSREFEGNGQQPRQWKKLETRQVTRFEPLKPPSDLAGLDIYKKEDERYEDVYEDECKDVYMKPLSYYNIDTSSDTLPSKILNEEPDQSTCELKARVGHLENEIQVLLENMYLDMAKKEIGEENCHGDILYTTKALMEQRARTRSQSFTTSLDSGDTKNLEPHFTVREMVRENSLSHAQLEDMFASTDFIKIFVDQIENVLLDIYLKHALDFDVDFDFNLNFLSLHKKTSFSELQRTKSRIPDELIEHHVDDVAEELSRTTGKPIDVSKNLIFIKLKQLKDEVDFELKEVIECLEQRINSFCEKYVKVWKDGYSIQRNGHVTLDFENFILSVKLKFSANFDKISQWAVKQGKILDGHEFIDIMKARSSSVYIPV